MALEVLVRLPEGPARETPLLFVHGAWHGAWCWDVHFLPYFAHRGYRTAAVSLRGHGESAGKGRLRWTGIREYVEDVAAAARGLERPPVVIGHSMGGLVVQKYLETHQAPAGVLLASSPVFGAVPATLRVFAKHPLPFLEANLRLGLYPLVGTPERARSLLFSPGLPEAKVRDYQRRLQDESYRAYWDMMGLALPRPKRVTAPVLVLGGERDGVFTPGEVAATARAYGAEAVIFSGQGHDLMLEPGWRDVADRILAWLEERGI